MTIYRKYYSVSVMIFSNVAYDVYILDGKG